MESRSVKELGSSRIQTECAMTAELLQNTLSIEQQCINGEAPDLSPLALAYVGDSIYDFRVRDYLCRRYQVNLYYAGKISRLISLVEKGLEHLLAEDEAKE